MKKQKKKQQEHSGGLVWMCFFAALVLTAGLSCYLQKPARADISKSEKETELEYISDLYYLPGQVLEPEPIIKTEDGKEFKLFAWEPEPVLISGRQKDVSGEIIYRAVEGQEGIPETASIEVSDEESGTSFMAELPLFQNHFFNETWENDFHFTVTFHSYDSDSYRLGELEIPYCEEQPELEGSEQELLALLGLDEEDYRILGYEWKGGPYWDLQGLLCRDAQAYGKKKTADCTAIYKGTVELPDFYQYRTRALYKSIAGSSDLTIQEAELEGIDESSQRMDEKLLQKLKKMAKICLKVTIGIGCLILAAIGFRFLIVLAKKAKEKRNEWID